MPKSISNSGSTSKAKFKRGFKALADGLALNYRRQLNIKDYDPLDAKILASHLGLELLAPHELYGMTNELLQQLVEPPGCNCWSAFTLGIEGRASVILYNSSHSNLRHQSDIMHECAHVSLNHKMEEIDLSLGIPLRQYDLSQEHEAEWLGGCLQLPKEALVKYYVYKNYSVQQIADLFEASTRMVNYRIAVTGMVAIKGRIAKKYS